MLFIRRYVKIISKSVLILKIQSARQDYISTDNNNFVKKVNKMFYTTVYNELTFTTTYP